MRLGRKVTRFGGLRQAPHVVSHFYFGHLMTEQALLEYFQNRLSADELAKDLKGSQRKTGYDTSRVYVAPIDDDQTFIVTRDHLIKLTTDTLNGALTPEDLNTIAFAIISSEFFTLNSEGIDVEIIETVIHDWDNYEIGFALSMKNIALWKEYLQTGNYKLDKEELKKKFRSDKKRK